MNMYFVTSNTVFGLVLLLGGSYASSGPLTLMNQIIPAPTVTSTNFFIDNYRFQPELLKPKLREILNGIPDGVEYRKIFTEILEHDLQFTEERQEIEIIIDAAAGLGEVYYLLFARRGDGLYAHQLHAKTQLPKPQTVVVSGYTKKKKWYGNVKRNYYEYSIPAEYSVEDVQRLSEWMLNTITTSWDHPFSPRGYFHFNNDGFTGWACVSAEPAVFLLLDVLDKNGNVIHSGIQANELHSPGMIHVCGGSASHHFFFRVPSNSPYRTSSGQFQIRTKYRGKEFYLRSADNHQYISTPHQFTGQWPSHPIGWFHLRNEQIDGWSCIPQLPDAILSVNIITEHGEVVVEGLRADNTGEAGIGLACGGHPTNSNHRFRWVVPADHWGRKHEYKYRAVAYYQSQRQELNAAGGSQTLSKFHRFGAEY